MIGTDTVSRSINCAADINDGHTEFSIELEPSDLTNHWPNDNRDPQRRMWWDESGNPAGYLSLQSTLCLSYRSRNATHVPINGVDRYAAETTLRPTSRYAGDNYQVRATLRKPAYENDDGRFDTHTGMNASNHQFNASTIRETLPLVAWKRVYIEQDNMYTMGATIVSNVPVWTRVLHVDNVEDFGIGNNVTLFWKSGGTILQESGTISLVEPGKVELQDGISQIIPPYAGIKPQGHTATYIATREYLPNAFGACPQGTDGGAFTEFRPAPTGNDSSPKLTLIDGYFGSHWFSYRQAWFDHILNGFHKNVAHLLMAHNATFGGAADTTDSTCVVVAGGVSATRRENVVVHEIGHRFGLKRSNQFPASVARGPGYDYIDTHASKLSFDGQTVCVMDYNAVRNSNAKFSIEGLLTGSGEIEGIGQEDSLRDRDDK